MESTTAPFATYSPFTTVASAAGGEASNRSSVAALAFLVWDILITLEDEVQFIWPQKFSYTKLSYFFVRYTAVIVEASTLLIGSELTPRFHFTPHACYIWQVYQGVAAMSIVIVVDLILILRVNALYQGNLTIQRVVLVLYVMEMIGMSLGLALALPGITFDKICLVLHIPVTLGIYAGASIIFQSTLFSLTSWKFIQAVRSGWNEVPLVMLLVRDGTWAFFLLFFVYAGELGLFGLKNHAFAGVLYGWLLTIFSFSGYRLLLNIRHFDNATVNEDPSYTTAPNVLFVTRILTSRSPSRNSYELEERTSLYNVTFPPSSISAVTLA